MKCLMYEKGIKKYSSEKGRMDSIANRMVRNEELIKPYWHTAQIKEKCKKSLMRKGAVCLGCA